MKANPLDTQYEIGIENLFFGDDGIFKILFPVREPKKSSFIGENDIILLVTSKGTGLSPKICKV